MLVQMKGFRSMADALKFGEQVGHRLFCERRSVGHRCLEVGHHGAAANNVGLLAFFHHR